VIRVIIRRVPAGYSRLYCPPWRPSAVHLADDNPGVAIQPELGYVLTGMRVARWRRVSFQRVFARGGLLRCYGAAAGGSQGPSVNSMVSASRASMFHFAVVDR